MKPVPYPPDAKANGRPLELDLEELQQDEVWALANEIPGAQAAILMLRLVAWAQTPCGSLCADENVLRAMCRLSAADWPRLREVLMRGWWLADDGRLYHDALVPRVSEMLFKRSRETRRNQAWRADKSSANRRQRVGNAVHARDTDISNPIKKKPLSSAPTSQNRERVPAVTISRVLAAQITFAMKRAGVNDLNPSHPKLLALIAAGTTVDEFVEAASKSVASGKGFAYALAIVEGQRKEAAALAGQQHTQPLPAVSPGQPIEHPRNIINVESPYEAG